MIDKKEMLKGLMKRYVDEHGCMDITKFRTENASEYALLPHYFGGIDKAIEQCGWVKKALATNKKGNKKVKLRDQLAYDMLVELRKTKTLEQIAQRYGVTRPGINQLFKALTATIEGVAEENNETGAK
jgi:hypothetical protein